MPEQYNIVDIGINLAHRSFHADRKAVIQRAFDAGVRTMVITGTSQANSQEVQRIAREYPGQLYSTAGVHPHDSQNCTLDTIAELRRLAALEQVVAIGECGLDFNRDFSPRPQQEKWFEAQVALAEELQKPLFLHERDAGHRFCEILSSARKSVPPWCIVSPARASPLKRISIWGYTSVLPAGFAMSAGASPYVNSFARSPSTVS